MVSYNDGKKKSSSAAPGSGSTGDGAAGSNAGAAKQKLSAYGRAAGALKSAEDGTPQFSSDYDADIAQLYAGLGSLGDFSYDPDSDPLYGSCKEQYVLGGQKAMKDAMGQAAALTGGYSNSYGAAAGQQVYDDWITRLGELIPELYGKAYERRLDEAGGMRDMLSAAVQLRDSEYSQFRDAVSDSSYAAAQALQEAEARAQYGDFSGYAGLYGDDAARQMLLTWAVTNPLAAYTNGQISAGDYWQLTGKYPRGTGGAPGGSAGDPWAYGGSGWNSSSSAGSSKEERKLGANSPGSGSGKSRRNG